MIIIPIYLNPINNGIEFPSNVTYPIIGTYIESFVDMENYYFFETIEERDAFYKEHGLSIEPRI
jgi:hypothetical protein